MTISDRSDGDSRRRPERMLAGDLCLADDPELIDARLRRDKGEAARPITIGDNVWLGGVIVLPGVNVGDDAVVGAGAVLARDVPAGAVVAGNPARPLRPRA